MKRFITVSLTAGLLAIGSSALLADSATNSTANSAQTVTPSAPAKASDTEKKTQERRRFMALLGVGKGELKGLSPEDRKTKIKSLADKKISELEAKQTAGSITDKEQSDLSLLKKFEKRAKTKPKTDS